MTVFRYSALTRDGELVIGELSAADSIGAIMLLHERALLPIDAVEQTVKGLRSDTSPFSRMGRLSGQDLALACQQLARLLKAGLPLDRALAILVDLSEKRRMRQAWQSALDKVRDGGSLAEALYAQGRRFPETFVTLVRAGELSGALQGVLVETATFLTRSEAIRQKIISAMVYPVILIVVASLSVGLILTAVLPQFEPMFKEAGAKLPVSTQFVVAAGDFLRTDWWALVIFIAALVLSWRQLARSPAGKAIFDRTLLRFPVLRHLVVRFEVGRFCRTLGVMLANGVPAPTALSLAGSTMGNAVLARAAEDAASRFREGEGLSGPLNRTGHFPALAIQLIRIGEETGRLDDMLEEVAELFDQEVQRLLERLLAALVPGLTLVMGGLIALIVGAVMSALMSINALAI